MSVVSDYLARLLGGAAFWVVVLPWQQALRVRGGRHVRLLKPGIYLKVPILDVVQVESVRRRTSMVPIQTLSTAIAAQVFRLQRHEIDPGRLCELVNSRLVEAFSPYGLSNVTLYITDFAFVRTIRLIQDQRWFHGRALDMQDRSRGGA
jgi:hypothetical protein